MVLEVQLFCPLVGHRPQLVDSHTYDSVHPLAGEGDMGIPSIEGLLGLHEVSECLDKTGNGFVNVGCVLICDYVLNSSIIWPSKSIPAYMNLC